MKRIRKLVSLLLAFSVLFSSVQAFALYNVVKKQIITLGRGWDLVEKSDIVYLADGTGGVQVIDIKDRQNSERISVIDTGFDARTVDIYKNYLYVSGGSKMITYNVKNPQQPVLIKTDLVGGSVRSNISGNKLGIFGGSASTIFDISNPESPQRYASITGYGNTMSGLVNNNIVYIISTQGVLNVYDISNSQEIKTLSTAAVANASYVQDMLVDGDYLYLADENGLVVLDVSDPSKPVQTCRVEKKSKLQGLWQEGDELYAVCYNNPMLIFDVSNKKDVKLKKEVTGMPLIAYAVKKLDRYILLAGNNGFAIIDSEFEIDKTKIPKVPTEDVLFRSDETDSTIDYQQYTFDDTKEHWAKNHIGKMNSLGYIKGVGKNLFKPENNVTRAELLTIAVRMLTPAVERYKQRFADVVDSDWYSDYVETACVLELIPDSMIKNNELKPNQPATREEMATITVNLMKAMKDITYSQDEYVFADDNDISDWAKESIYIAYQEGIVNGVGADMFKPQDNCTRAQICKILSDMYTSVNDEGETFIAKKYDISKNQPQEFTKVYEKPVVETEGIPYVINVSDVVLPGELLSLHGEWLTDAEIYIASGNKYELTEEFEKIETINADTAGQSITCQIPENMPAGTFTVFLKNSLGTSAPIAINNARFIWSDQEEVEQGGELRIYGRNFVAEEFGGELKTSVAFIGDDGVYLQKVTSINPYEIKIEVTKETPVGEYDICVSNDGERWNKSVEAVRGKIIVKEEVYDPYGLNQPWADEFVWDNKIDITAAPYNADKTGVTDNTAIIQKAIDDAGQAGGGVVYFPEGTYKFGPLKMAPRVVLMGDGMEKSKMVYENHAENAKGVQMFGTNSEAKLLGKIGFLNLGFTVADGTVYPDTYFWLGEDWGSNIQNGSERTAEHIFLKGCKIQTSMLKNDDDGRGLACVMVAKGHILYENNIFYGHAVSPTSNWIGCYVHFINNHITSSVGNVSIAASYEVFDNNVFNRHHDLSMDQTTNVQGLFMRGLSYVHHNTIRNTGKGNKNDGELVCTEQYRGGSRISGSIVESGKDFVVVDHYTNSEGVTVGHENNIWTLDTAWGSSIEIIITAGKGLGQRKTIKSLDEETRTITLIEEWDIIPDETSKFIVSPAAYATTIYNNYANTGRKGLWLYGDCLDSVVAENYVVDAEGAFSYTCYIVDETRGRINVSYFNRFYKNLTEGFSPHGNLCGIGVNAGVEDTEAEHVLVYASTLKDNTMIGETPVPEYTGNDCSEAPDYNGIYAVVYSRHKMTAPFVVLKSTIIENNSITDFDRGISVGYSPQEKSRENMSGNMTESYTLRNNKFTNVDLEIDAYEANGLVNLDDVK